MILLVLQHNERFSDAFLGLEVIEWLESLIRCVLGQFVVLGLVPVSYQTHLLASLVVNLLLNPGILTVLFGKTENSARVGVISNIEDF